MNMNFFIFVFFLLLPLGESFDNMCTTIGVGPDATVDGSTFVTHTADCKDCDFRLSKTPSKIWEEGSMRPVYGYRRQVRIIGEIYSASPLHF